MKNVKFISYLQNDENLMQRQCVQLRINTKNKMKDLVSKRRTLTCYLKRFLFLCEVKLDG